MAQTIDLDNPEFQDIWKLISYTRQSVFMTGKAGTGKSTFLRYIVENTKKKTVVLAPTGIAAVNAGGVTLHSFFHLPLKPLLPDDPELTMRNLRQRLKHTGEQQKLIRELELIVIDEVSMVRADIIDFIDKVLRLYSGRLREPFGGKQLLLVGDVFQLEPVVTADMRDIFRDLYPNLYFFSAKIFREFSLVPIELKKVYRQSDTDFIGMLDRMRLGASTAADIATLNAKVIVDKSSRQEAAEGDAATKKGSKAEEKAKSDDFTVTLAPKRDTVDAINTYHLEKLHRKLYSFHGEIRDKFPENSLPAPLVLELKVGAQVVFVRNDPERRWVNGTVGKVHSISDNSLEISLENGQTHVVNREIWENVSYRYNKETKKIDEEVLGTFTQYPLRLAWALTIHKSQGLTFSKVIIDMQGGAFAAGQAYVALSRCQSLEGLTLKSKLNPYDFFVNPAIRSFSTMFNNQSLFSAAMTAAKADDCFHRAANLFDQGEFSQSVDLFIEGLYARDELRNQGATRLIKQKLYRLGRTTERIIELEEQLRQRDETLAGLAKEYISMGLDCLSDENYGAAIANFDKALKISPDNLEALRMKAEATMDGGDLVAAAECFGELLKRKPNDFDALFGIGKLHCQLADESAEPDEERYKALNYLLAAEEQKPDSAPLHQRLASLHEAMGDQEEADRHRAIARRLRKRKP
jgi:tetratricopeptide (TPR) repeat protein